ncbi:MAG: formylmethanofuran dehydrogenase subunit C [Planctomycetales bacterium]|nr:formylmethanofuran dehydrogenase subunit C [Planctomycetales bacterium]
MLNLRLRIESPLTVETEGLTTDWACDKSLGEIERFPIQLGGDTIPLAEAFEVTGDPRDQRHTWEGELDRVHWIAAGMASGEVRIVGSAGRHAGSQMRGGRLVIEGNAGDFVGAHLVRGSIHVRGDAGDGAGGAYPGARRGMRGGCLLVDGCAGDEAGALMRRGVIAVGGDLGALAGRHMLAGTIVGFGSWGRYPGMEMRRGTLLALGASPPSLGPTFAYACQLTTKLAVLIGRHLLDQGFRAPNEIPTQLEMANGDALALGRGEVLWRTDAR